MKIPVTAIFALRFQIDAIVWYGDIKKRFGAYHMSALGKEVYVVPKKELDDFFKDYTENYIEEALEKLPPWARPYFDRKKYREDVVQELGFLIEDIDDLGIAEWLSVRGYKRKDLEGVDYIEAGEYYVVERSL